METTGSRTCWRRASLRLRRASGFRTPSWLRADRRRVWAKPALYVAAVVAVLWLAATLLPIKTAIASSMTWIQTNPALGAFLLPLVVCVGIPLCIPSPGFEILAGSMFGMVYGVLLSVVGKTCGQLLAFSLGKRFGKERISGYMQRSFPAFTALSAVLQSPNWKPLLLVQVANVPHLVKCYGLALADVPTHRFLVSSLVGGFPYAVLWAYIGYHSKSLVVSSDEDEATQQGDPSTQYQVLIGVAGTLLTLAAMAWLVVYTKQQLRVELQKADKLSQRRGSEDSDDTCITILSSDDNDDVEDDEQQDDEQQDDEAAYSADQTALLKSKGSDAAYAV